MAKTFKNSFTSVKLTAQQQGKLLIIQDNLVNIFVQISTLQDESKNSKSINWLDSLGAISKAIEGLSHLQV